MSHAPIRTMKLVFAMLLVGVSSVCAQWQGGPRRGYPDDGDIIPAWGIGMQSLDSVNSQLDPVRRRTLYGGFGYPGDDLALGGRRSQEPTYIIIDSTDLRGDRPSGGDQSGSGRPIDGPDSQRDMAGPPTLSQGGPPSLSQGGPPSLSQQQQGPNGGANSGFNFPPNPTNENLNQQQGLNGNSGNSQLPLNQGQQPGGGPQASRNGPGPSQQQGNGMQGPMQGPGGQSLDRGQSLDGGAPSLDVVYGHIYRNYPRI